MALACVGPALAAAIAAGACGGGDSSAGGDDSGAPAAEAGGVDVTAEAPAHDSGGGVDAPAGPEGSTGGDAAGDAPADAAFSFDGFAHADGYSEAAYCPDDDGDGFTVCGGDCNDHDSLINPCAFDTNDPTDDVGHDGIDNDCDGHADNLVVCESGIAAGHGTNAFDYAHASDVCDHPQGLCKHVVNAVWYGPTPLNAQRITGHMGNAGTFNPRLGALMSFLSSGLADDLTDSPSYATCRGTDYGVTFNNPMPLPAAQNVNPCGTGADEATTVHDYTELRMTLHAPPNAGSFSFDFAFFSAEYPVYVCQGFNDTFLAIQTSAQYPQGYQISYDSQTPPHRINVNSAFFQDCNSITNMTMFGYTHACANPIARLNGTGYETLIQSAGVTCNDKLGSGGTDWLTTTSPVQPGETFTLSWVVFDEGDGILDSSAILDHFHWHSSTLGSPVTGR
jgi:hypothetical protein